MNKRSLSRSRERGVALFIVLIALVAMALSALTTLRSVDTSLMLSGNAAFRSAATQAADLGIEAAVNELQTTLSSNAEAIVSGKYYPSTTPAAGGLTLDAVGLPPDSVWGSAPTLTSAGSSGVPDGFTVAYVIERLCSGALPITDKLLACVVARTQDNGSNRSGTQKYTGAAAIYYRVTIRVTGPHNTVRYVQTTLSY